MSDIVSLTARADIGEEVEVDGLTPDRLATLDERDIASLPIWMGRHRGRLGDLFDVRGGRTARVRIAGDLRRIDGIGAGTAGGEMLIEGGVGRRLAAGMSGGWIDVRGGAGDEAGLGMSGGALRIIGNAGDRIGCPAAGASKGMSGGEIIVNGNAGAGAAARVRRGLVVVAGDLGADAARAMIAGTVVVFGRVGPRPGRGTKRGSIVALGGIHVPETFRYACTYQPVYVRMLLTYLRRRYGLSVEDEALNGRFRRYCGDAGDIGKGEILELIR